LAVVAAVVFAAGCGDRAAQPLPKAGEQVAEAGQRSPVDSGDPSSRGLDSVQVVGRSPTEYRRLWAVIVGINAYPGGVGKLKPLHHAVNDAREFRDLLIAEFGFAKERVKYLEDADATAKNLAEAFSQWLPEQQLDPRDGLVIFFAGHGLAEEQDGYLAAVDSDLASVEKTCLSVAKMREQLTALPCRHKLVILDSCYSGALFDRSGAIADPYQGIARTKAGGPSRGADEPESGQRGPATGAATPAGDNLAYYFRRPAFVGMSAGRYSPVADGLGKNSHSIFTATLLAVLRERADSLREDHAFNFRAVAVEVEKRVRDAPGSRQIPNWGSLDAGADGDFVFRPTVARLTPREQQEKMRRESESLLSQSSLRTIDTTLRFASTEADQLLALQELRQLVDTHLSRTAGLAGEGERAYEFVLPLKGAVSFRQRKLRGQPADAELSKLLAEYDRVTAELAHAALTSRTAAEVRERTARLAEERLWLESKRWKAAVGKDASQFRSPTLAEVKQHLPQEAVLVDFFEYAFQPVDAGSGSAAGPAPAKTGQSPEPGERRLAAFVVSRDKPTVQVDLGPSRQIAELIAQVDLPREASEWLSVLYPTRGAGERGAAAKTSEAALNLKRMVWNPLEPAIAASGATVIVLCPEGALSQLNFLTLPGSAEGKYLLEEKTLVYIPAALLVPELFAGAAASHVPESLLLVGDPDFDAQQDPPAVDAPALSRDAFQRLAGTLAELMQIDGQFRRHAPEGKIVVARGSGATEALVRAQAPSFQLVHFATHGDYMPGDNASSVPDELPPSLRAFVALAGANHPAGSGVSDGMLTALEIGCLDWRGTDLLVFSTCGAARGKAISGECSQGLLRSVHLAGVDTVIAAMGDVNDRPTQLLMGRFYENLFAGKLSRAQSLREAQLWLLDQGAKALGAGDEVASQPAAKRLPPFFWASFVLSGDWR
jgi:CHAT domain-containing protein